MNKLTKGLALLLCTGSVFTCAIAKDPDCGCKKDDEVKTEEVEKDNDCGCKVIEEETLEKAE